MPSPLASQRATALPSAPSLSGVPVPLRAAFELMIAHDSRSEVKTIREKALSFLKATRDLVAEPEGLFAQAMVTHCLQIRFARRTENKALSEFRSSELPYLSQRINDGFRKVQLAEFYHSLSGPLPMDVKGVRAFQRDYLAHLNEMISTVEHASEVPESLLRPIDQLSGFVLGFCRKERVPSPHRKGASAHDIATLLTLAEQVDLLTLKIAVSALTQRDGLESLKAAVNPIVSRARGLGVAISPEIEREVTEWAKRGEPLTLSKLTLEDRDVLVRNLRVSATQLLKGECGALMELDWMASVQDAQRDFEYLYDKADRNPANPDHVPEYPEVNYRFARTLRLTMRELNDLKRASEHLQQEKLSEMRVEMDQSPFLWPRIAEAILASKPAEIILHSPTANEPFDAPTNPSVKPFLCQRSMHVVPVSLTTCPKHILEQEVYLASKQGIEWTSGAHGKASFEDRTIAVRIDHYLQTHDAVRAVASHTKAHSNCFIIKNPSGLSNETPLAFGILFPSRFLDIPGYTSHTFGKTIQLYTPEVKKEALVANPAPVAQPQSVAPVQEMEGPPPAINSLHPAPPQTPITPEQPIAPAQKPEVVLPKKVKKAPPPPPVKEPRPRISDEHALVSRQVVAAIPEIQAAARSSRALKPEVPFTNPEMVTALHILKNGEKPGNKKLKALRDYVANDCNFRDALTSARLKTCREELGKLLDSLIS